eukprot:TRINITY_DN6303_c0_g1_i1.p1 TRINITY_DN6303_c0_g1~~TRINITY_DN6303_c0_g1_i1.p1  ORF type:complete len:335 (-),score=57.50 TRINITY_DN6303_c0_g1_i1:114-1118(-)
MRVGQLRVCFFLRFSSEACQICISCSEKLQFLWERIEQDQGRGGWWPDFLSFFAIFLEDMHVSGESISDILPASRSKKLIHSVGAVAKVRFVWNGSHPYTGMFRQAESGLLRASLATRPSSFSPVIPGLSIKVLRDGVPSANTFAMYEMDGQGDDANFFRHPLCNHVADRPDLPLLYKTLFLKFNSASGSPGMVGLLDWSKLSENGTQHDPPRFPFALVFQPNPAITALFSPQSYDDILPALTRHLHPPQVLYKVYAASDMQSVSLEYLGYIQLSSVFVLSRFGDEQLFFRHPFMSEDYTIRADWEKDYADWGDRRWETEGIARYASMLPPFEH